MLGEVRGESIAYPGEALGGIARDRRLGGVVHRWLAPKSAGRARLFSYNAARCYPACRSLKLSIFVHGQGGTSALKVTDPFFWYWTVVQAVHGKLDALRVQPFSTRFLIIPSCATLAISRPSRVNTRPRLKPRPAPDQGLSVA